MIVDLSSLARRSVLGLLLAAAAWGIGAGSAWGDGKNAADPQSGKDANKSGAGVATPAAELPVVVPSPGMIKLAEAQAAIAAHVAEKSVGDDELRALDERIAALSQELTKLSARRNEILEKDPKYRALLERQAEAIKTFRVGE